MTQSLPLNENSNPASRSASPKPKAEAKIPSQIPPHPRPEQGQIKTHQQALEASAVRDAFLLKSTAADFMSGYGSNTGLVARVYEIGLAIDELATARANYLQRLKEMDAHLSELDRHLPAGPYGLDIKRKVRAITSIREIETSSLDKQVSGGHQPRPHQPTNSGNNPPPTPPHRPSQPQVVAKASGPTTAIPPPPSNGRTHSPIQRPAKAYQHRYRPCSLCGRLGHLPTQCSLYHCIHCETTAPGHFAKFCSRNPHQGVDRRHLPPSALAILQSKENHRSSPTTPRPNTTTIKPNPVASSTLQSNVASVPTPPYTRAKLSVDNVNAHARDTSSTPRVTIAIGPTYKPVFIAKKPNSGATKDLGRLHQLHKTPTTHPTGGKTPDHRRRPQQPQRSRSPSAYEGDYEFDYDDVALYNMTGKGYID